jgi:hypothetical protein
MREHSTVTHRYELDFGLTTEESAVEFDIETTRVNENVIICTAHHITTTSLSPRALRLAFVTIDI